MKLFEGVTLRGGLEKTGNIFNTVHTKLLIKLSLVQETSKNMIEESSSRNSNILNILHCFEDNS